MNGRADRSELQTAGAPADAPPRPLRPTGSPFAAFFLRECCCYFHSRQFPWNRLGFLVICAVTVFGTFTLEAEGHHGWLYPGAGLYAFCALMSVNALYAFSLINSTFSQILIPEREQGGLDLLRITGLTPLAMLLGKGTSQYVHALLMLVLQLPLAAACWITGGIGIREIALSYLLLAVVLFAACQAGAHASLVSKSGREASHSTLGQFLTVIILPWFLFALFNPILPPLLATFLGWLMAMNPFAAFTRLILTKEWSWQVPVFYLGFGLAFLALAVKRFENAATRPFLRPGEKVRAARGSRPRQRNVPRVGDRPFAWKEFYFTETGRRGVIARVVAYPLLLLVLFVCSESSPHGSLEVLGRSMLVVGLLGLSSELPYAATRLFGWEVTNQTLGDLAALPVAPRRIIFEKILGHVPFAIPPLIFTVFGALLVGGTLVQQFPDHFTMGVVFYTLVQTALVLLVTIYYSLIQPRSAFVAAFMLVGMSDVALHGLGALIFGPHLGWSIVAVSLLSVGVFYQLCRLLPGKIELAASK